jgi:hypothetical protein
VAQGIGSEFKLQYYYKKKKERKETMPLVVGINC